MKNNKGITITSLVVYIAIVIVVTATIIRITTHFRTSLSDVADVSFETEFQKINLYLLTESKTIGNNIEEIEQGNKIIFTNGNKYEYNSEEQAIYLNDSITICNNVQECTFGKKIADNGKTVLEFTVKINETNKTMEYVMTNDKQEEMINETDYTWNTVE